VTTLGDKLRRLRTGRSYAVIARAAECSPPTIRQIEAGRTLGRDVRIIARLAKFFEVSLGWLADDTADWPAPKSDRDRIVDQVQGALTGAGLAGELSPDELEILATVRKLGPVQRVKLAGYLAGLSSGVSLTAEDIGPFLQEGVDKVLRARRTDPKRSEGSGRQSQREDQTA